MFELISNILDIASSILIIRLNAMAMKPLINKKSEYGRFPNTSPTIPRESIAAPDKASSAARKESMSLLPPTKFRLVFGMTAMLLSLANLSLHMFGPENSAPLTAGSAASIGLSLLLGGAGLVVLRGDRY